MCPVIIWFYSRSNFSFESNNEIFGENKEDLFMVFIDLKKLYNKVPRNII